MPGSHKIVLTKAGWFPGEMGYQGRGRASRFTSRLSTCLFTKRTTYIHAQVSLGHSGVLELETHLCFPGLPPASGGLTGKGLLTPACWEAWRCAAWALTLLVATSPVPVAVDKALGASAQSLTSRPNSGYNSLVATPRITAERKNECPVGEWPHPCPPSPHSCTFFLLPQLPR